jgi:hypothetical protein
VPGVSQGEPIVQAMRSELILQESITMDPVGKLRLDRSLC